MQNKATIEEINRIIDENLALKIKANDECEKNKVPRQPIYISCYEIGRKINATMNDIDNCLKSRSNLKPIQTVHHFNTYKYVE